MIIQLPGWCYLLPGSLSFSPASLSLGLLGCPSRKNDKQTSVEATLPFMTYLLKSHITTIPIFCWLHKVPCNTLLEGNTQSRYYQSSSRVWLLTWLFLHGNVGAREFYNSICGLQGWLHLFFYWTTLIWKIKFKPLCLAWTPASLLLPLPLFIYHMLTYLENSLFQVHAFSSTPLSLGLFNSLTLCMHLWGFTYACKWELGNSTLLNYFLS